MPVPAVCEFSPGEPVGGVCGHRLQHVSELLIGGRDPPDRVLLGHGDHQQTAGAQQLAEITHRHLATDTRRSQNIQTESTRHAGRHVTRPQQTPAAGRLTQRLTRPHFSEV